MFLLLIALISAVVMTAECHLKVPYIVKISHRRIQSDPTHQIPVSMFVHPVVDHFGRNDPNIDSMFAPQHILDSDLIGSDSVRVNSINKSQRKFNGRQFKQAFGSEFTDAFSSFGKAFGSSFGSAFRKGFDNKNTNKLGKSSKSMTNTRAEGSYNNNNFMSKDSGFKFKPLGKIFGGFSF